VFSYVNGVDHPVAVVGGKEGVGYLVSHILHLINMGLEEIHDPHIIFSYKADSCRGRYQQRHDRYRPS
jgi:hypothetical protein